MTTSLAQKEGMVAKTFAMQLGTSEASGNSMDALHFILLAPATLVKIAAEEGYRVMPALHDVK